MNGKIASQLIRYGTKREIISKRNIRYFFRSKIGHTDATLCKAICVRCHQRVILVPLSHVERVVWIITIRETFLISLTLNISLVFDESSIVFTSLRKQRMNRVIKVPLPIHALSVSVVCSIDKLHSYLITFWLPHSFLHIFNFVSSASAVVLARLNIQLCYANRHECTNAQHRRWYSKCIRFPRSECDAFILCALTYYLTTHAERMHFV